MTDPNTLTYADRLVPDENVFAVRDPEAAPLWLEIVCGLLMAVIWGATFYAIGGL